MTVEEHLVKISTRLAGINETMIEIKAENLRVWDRLEEHSTAMNKMKGWIAGIAASCTIFGIILTLAKFL
jgi:hypothetical protein